MKKEIEELQALLKEKGWGAYVVFTQDAHQSEYVASYWKVRRFLSGFTGSAGILVITLKEARLWTDGRYFLQAAAQLEGSGIELMRDGEKNVPTWPEWIYENVPEGSVVGMDGRTLSLAAARMLKTKWENKKLSLKVQDDLGGSLWKDRPGLPSGKIMDLSIAYAGENRQAKLSRLKEHMTEIGADSYLICSLESVAWLLNLRGNDVEFTPVFYAFLLAEQNGAHKLFVDADKLPEELKKELADAGVALCRYEDCGDYLEKLTGSIAYDPATISVQLFEQISSECKKVEEAEICGLWRSLKNDTEQKNFREAHLKDGVAMVQFISWLKEAVKTQSITECEAADRLSKLRLAQTHSLGDSFGAIVAYGPNAAIVHYDPQTGTNSTMKPEGFVLVDSGGHYLEGTTDITRTIALGKLSRKEKKAYTLVLKGHIALARAVFPEDFPGNRIDILARMPLWREGLDYRHGTGHGVGYVLSVHEGPQNIGPSRREAGFKAGMVTSDEPGYYEAGEYGVRIENLVLSRERQFKEESRWGKFLEFETLTLCPYEREAILSYLLTAEEKKWLNAYNRTLRKKLMPKLNKDESKYLRNETKWFW